MIYKDFQGLKLSALGMGAMRLPVIGSKDKDIDEKETQAMVDYAMEHGVNYYDTAWGYHEGNSEIVMGKALDKYPRENFFLADKFPGYDLANMPKVEEIFEEQLKRCNVDYFDFYLFHNVCEMNINEYLDPKNGIDAYLREQKSNGRIRHLGFSAHGSCDNMKIFLDAYGDHIEFCQIQLNYLDWTFQHAGEKVDLLNDYNIPIWVMEPLRGGKLATLPEELASELTALRPDEKVPAWAFRFLQSVPNVVVTLSGMSNFEQIRENVKTYETDAPLNEEEKKAVFSVSEKLLEKNTLPCTECRYCTSHCPQELDIPALISLYNESRFTDNDFIAPMALAAMPKDKRPSACTGCRSCEDVCPQQIKISEAMADFTKKK